MTSASAAPSTPPSSPGYAGLGTGSDEDRLGFRLVLGLLLRCLGLLRPVRGHVVALVLGFVTLGIFFLPLVLVLFDLFWNRALLGEPLTSYAANGLGLDPSLAVDVDVLDAETRRFIARQAVVIGCVAGLVIVPVFVALYYYQVWILQRVNQLLRIDLVGRLQSLSLRFHADNPVGDAIYRVYQDSAMVTQLIDVLFLTPVFALLRFTSMLFVVYWFEPELALVMAMVWPPALALGAHHSKRLRAGFRAAREANSDLTSRIQETIGGIRVIKAYGAEAREQARFEERSREAFRRAESARSRFARFNVGTFWIVGGILVTNSAWATILTHRGEPLLIGTVSGIAELAVWNLGLYGSFKFVQGSGTDQIRLLFRTWGRTQDIAIGLDRVFELLDLEPEVKERDDARPMPAIRDGVAFRGVSFSYQSGHPTLRDVDLVAPVGSITAIVGPTGSGKTTLMAMLLRLYDPDRGRIEVDGVDLRAFRLDSLRSRVSIALQENVLFATTVRENIRYAAPHATDAEVREAARIACADEFIEMLPDGYDTLLGERGTKLSSGQRQRLSIARAVLKCSDILILDEPTAALDAITERRVLGNLAEWGRDKTIFLITHRLSTVRGADQIVYLRDGRIVERGTHDDLLARGDGAYRALVAADALAVGGSGGA
jgi:ABC-type multidrug transport system fused ATPase/permease subunit